MRWWLLLLLIPAAQAHVPAFGAAGTTPETAFHVDDASKSWVFFEDAAVGDRWYRFDAPEGELFLSLSVPPAQASRPALWLVGPGLPEPAPPGSPAGATALRIETVDELGVEPFTPVALRTIAQWRQTTPDEGAYMVLVRSQDAGAFGLAIGARESFTPIEWIRVPVDRISIQDWAGVPVLFAFLGEAIAAVAVAVACRREARSEPRRFVGHLGAGIVAGSAATTLILTAIAVGQAGAGAGIAIPIILAAAAIGIGAWRSVSSEGRRWAGVGWGAAGLAAWAGLWLGPALLLAWSVWPGRRTASPDTASPA